MKSNSLRNNRKTLAALLLCTGFIAGHPLSMMAGSNETSLEIVQQQIKVSGVVKDSMGEPVIGASVVEKGTSNGIITDINGNFSLSVTSGATLAISYIGYKTQEVQAVTGKVIDVTLKDDTEMLEEVVVVGFGTQKKVNLTGSVGIATAKELESRPVSSATQALQGLVPGLKITTSSGALDQNMAISVRGTGTIGSSSGSPLILIDGMEGDKPAIIDLYADWCGPCRQTAPIMKELAKEYAGKITIYKVNVDKQKELAALFNATSIPLFVFIPMKGDPSTICR